MIGKNNCLGVALLAQACLEILMADESGDITVAGVPFREIENNSFMGFHDWLRDFSSPQKIIGLRFTPTDPDLFVRFKVSKKTAGKEYIKIKGNSMEVYFYDERLFDAGISDDQSFRYSKIMCSEKGDLAVIVDMESLNEGERRQVERMVSP
jgi:hypothetical protein